MSDMETVRYLLASWVLVRGKGGGFGKMVYRSFKTVFHLYNICTFPSYEEVSKYWKTSVLPPIHISVPSALQYIMVHCDAILVQ